MPGKTYKFFIVNFFEQVFLVGVAYGWNEMLAAGYLDRILDKIVLYYLMPRIQRLGLGV